MIMNGEFEGQLERVNPSSHTYDTMSDLTAIPHHSSTASAAAGKEAQ